MISLICSPKIKHQIGIESVVEKLKLFSLENERFKMFLNVVKFDHEYTKPINVSGYDILKILSETEITVTIGTYEQNWVKWRAFPVNAYKPANRKDAIYINLRQLSRRSEREWEETLWHELIHVADDLSSFSFGHGDNSLKGKDKTAPVKLARIMAAMSLPEKFKEALYV